MNTHTPSCVRQAQRAPSLAAGAKARRSRSSLAAFAIAIIGICLVPSTLLAVTTIPRGDSFYYHPLKFVAFLGVFLLWVRMCWWVDQDSRELKQPTEYWNGFVFVGGAIGLLFSWMVPFSLLNFPLLVICCLGPSMIYSNRRDGLVSEEEKVLTSHHFRMLANRWFRLPMPGGEGGDSNEPVPVRLIGKSGQKGAALKSFKNAESSPGYRAALELIHEAVTLRATDIHMEPTKEALTVRFRIDGIMQSAEPYSRSMGDSMLNIFKVLADMDITEKRKPQDGSFSAEILDESGKSKSGSRAIDFRVATAGSVAGEKMVMRLLDRSKRVNDLSQIGMRDKIREQVRALAGQPHGMFIVCGPTGSGKSTTLYACLSEIDRFTKNVITLENPVEYQIDNCTQIEINPKAGKTFASELRSILRQDPDVIYIGEIRDNETAEIACQAAQTGHMVFTTLHANDTVTALNRLVDLGVAPSLISNAVSGILGQRLVRVLCPKCKQKYKPNADILRKANLPVDKIRYFYRPPPEAEKGTIDQNAGCKQCGGAGYRGRSGVFELLVITDKIRELIHDGCNPNAIKAEAVKNGMVYLQEDGLRQVIEGDTSVQELLRVCK